MLVTDTLPTAQAVLDGLRAAGIEANFEHTGGNVGTIFAGPVPEGAGPWAERRFALGPFVYEGGTAADEVLWISTTDEVGPEGEVVTVRQAVDTIRLVLDPELPVCRYGREPGHVPCVLAFDHPEGEHEHAPDAFRSLP